MKNSNDLSMIFRVVFYMVVALMCIILFFIGMRETAANQYHQGIYGVWMITGEGERQNLPRVPDSYPIAPESFPAPDMPVGWPCRLVMDWELNRYVCAPGTERGNI